jgi:hypothetical protein
MYWSPCLPPFDNPNNTWNTVQMIKLIIMELFHSHVMSLFLSPKILLRVCSETFIICALSFYVRDWDSAVSMATGYGLDDRGGRSSSPGRVKNFLSVTQTASGAHPASYPMGKESLSLGIQRPGHEADHSPPTSAKVKKTWILYIHSLTCLHGVVLN